MAQPQSLEWLDISQSPHDDGRVGLELFASVELANKHLVERDVQTLLDWLLGHGGLPDEQGEGLGRWSVDDQRVELDGRFEVAIALDMDAPLFVEMQGWFELEL